MKNRWLRSTCMLICLGTFALYCQNYSTISPLSNLIHQRFYFATRLENPMKLLTIIAAQCADPLTIRLHYHDMIPPELKNHAFAHERISYYKEKLLHETSLVPLFTLWEEIQEYKYLGNETFVREFLVLLVYFTKRVVHLTATLAPQEEEILEKAARLALEGPCPITLDVIALFVEQYYLNKSGKPFQARDFEVLLRTNNKAQIACDVTKKSNAIFERFYHIRRLTTSVEKLLSYHDDQALFCDNQKTSIFEKHLVFHNERVQSLIAQMEGERNAEPLQRAWRDFRRFKSMDDDQYLKDILKMLFAAYKNILTKKIPQVYKNQAHDSLATIEILYNQAEYMETEDMLNAIDMLTGELETIMTIAQQSERKHCSLASRRLWAGIGFGVGALGYYLYHWYKKS